MSTDLKGSLNQMRNRRNRQLEQDVGQALNGADIACKTNVKKLEKVFGIRPEPETGEIDAVAGVSEESVLYVLEAKDPTRPATIGDIANDIKAFFDGPKCYQAKLDRKLAYVRRAKYRVLASLGISSGKGWRVRAAFVTRDPTPAQFSAKRKYPFVLSSQIVDYLRNSQP